MFSSEINLTNPPKGQSGSSDQWLVCDQRPRCDRAPILADFSTENK